MLVCWCNTNSILVQTLKIVGHAPEAMGTLVQLAPWLGPGCAWGGGFSTGAGGGGSIEPPKTRGGGEGLN